MSSPPDHEASSTTVASVAGCGAGAGHTEPAPAAADAAVTTRSTRPIAGVIRPYEAGDLEELLAAWSAASSLAHPFLSDEFQAQERKNIAELYIPNTETWVWQAPDGVVRGFVAMMGNEIGGLFLDPSCHRQGIGRALLAQAWLTAGAVGGDELAVEVFKGNAVGRGFYDKVGFKLVREFVHEGSGQQVLRMVLHRDGDGSVPSAAASDGDAVADTPVATDDAAAPRSAADEATVVA